MMDIGFVYIESIESAEKLKVISRHKEKLKVISRHKEKCNTFQVKFFGPFSLLLEIGFILSELLKKDVDFVVTVAIGEKSFIDFIERELTEYAAKYDIGRLIVGLHDYVEVSL